METDPYEEEIKRSGEILKRNRHNSFTGEWYGPNPEPMPAGPNCACPGCKTRLLVWGT